MHYKKVDENNALESDMELESSQSPRQVMKSAKKKMYEKEKKDPFDIYGEYIAAELSSVNDDHAVTQAKYHINNILYELKMGRYNTYGYQTASSHTSSTPNNVQETEIREIARQDTNRVDAIEDEIEDSAILLVNLVNYLSDESTQ
ncbi:unnamed protein product [Parnassius mnemosyne]|uniref:Uncharacterized protein n=1 Tax=Parnassius mnemosyne TaxID=213953 RepID=A0AAV1LDW5_9NEOP